MLCCALRDAKGVRCFRPSGKEAFEQINVYSADNGGCKQRESDGNFEKNWCGAEPGATLCAHWLPVYATFVYLSHVASTRRTYSKGDHNKDDGFCHPFMLKVCSQHDAGQ